MLGAQRSAHVSAAVLGEIVPVGVYFVSATERSV